MSDMGFWRQAQAKPAETALISPEGVRTSFGELFEDVNRFSHGLREMGVEARQTLAVVMRNESALFEVFLSAMQLGLYYTPINYHSTAEEIAYILEDSEAVALFVSEDCAEVAGIAAEKVGLPTERCFVAGSAEGYRTFEDLKQDQPTTLPSDRIGGQIMQYTSGTTGKPKGVRRPITGVDADEATEGLKWLFEIFGLEPGEHDVWLVTSPLYHTANISLCSNSLHFGFTIVLMDKWSPEGTLDRIERYGVTATHMVPTQFVRLLDLDEEARGTYDVSSLRYALHGAAPCPMDVKRRMLDWWGPVIYEYYGSTEVGATIVGPHEWLERPGTVGRPFPISELKILDDDGHELPPGEVGKVYMRQGQDTIEYHKDPEKTQRARHGSLLTVGDLGYVDEDGYLFLCGRDAEVIIRGGVNIYPAEVEGRLIAHELVTDAAVIGVPDDEYGEQVKAVVALSDHAPADHEHVERELISYCREHLAKFKCPESVDVVDELPRDPNGKLYKHKVREPYWAGREKAI
jgi:long-chain acyl-CoA synthetase